MNSKLENPSTGRQEKGQMIRVEEADPYWNTVFLQAYLDGKINMPLAIKDGGPGRNHVAKEDIIEPELKEFMDHYRGVGVGARQWFMKATHKDIAEGWAANDYNSISRKYPRVFVHRSHSEETPPVHSWQDSHAGYAIDDLATPGADDDSPEAQLSRQRLTEGGIRKHYVLGDIPGHLIIDLREITGINQFGPVPGKNINKDSLTESPLGETKIRKILEVLETEDYIKDNVALIIVNENSAIVLDEQYLISLDRDFFIPSLPPEELPPQFLKAIELWQNDNPENIAEHIHALSELFRNPPQNIMRSQYKMVPPDFLTLIEKKLQGVSFDLYETAQDKIAALAKTNPNNQDLQELVSKAEKIKQETGGKLKNYIEILKQVRMENNSQKEIGSSTIQVAKTRYYDNSLKELLLIMEAYKENTH